MVKKKGIVWNYFTKKVYGSQITVSCKFCGQSYIQNATRMEKHVVRCIKCPKNIKHDFVRALRIKKAESLMELKLVGNWTESASRVINQGCNELNLPEWQYNGHQVVNDIMKNDDNRDIFNQDNKS